MYNVIEIIKKGGYDRMADQKNARVVKKAYSFENDAGKTIQGHNYHVRVPAGEFGEHDLKIVTKSDLDKQVLDKIADVVDD